MHKVQKQQQCTDPRLGWHHQFVLKFNQNIQWVPSWHFLFFLNSNDGDCCFLHLVRLLFVNALKKVLVNVTNHKINPWVEIHCDKWGGAESRGNGARPVEFMIMNDTCATHRSRFPQKSSGRIKGGAMTVEDERWPGLDFILCFVCGSCLWGAAAWFCVCLFYY